MRTVFLTTVALLAVMVLHGAAGAGVAAEPVTLRYTWTEGEPLFYRITQETAATTAGVPGQPETRVTQSQTMLVRLDVTDVEEESGDATIRATVNAIDFDMTTPTGEHVRYSSRENGDDDDARPEHPAARAMAAFVGESFTFDINRTGDISNVRGMDEILAKVGEATGDPAMQDTFRGRFGNTAMEAMLEQTFRTLPDQPVEASDSWRTTVEQPIPTLGTLRMESSLTLDRLEPMNGRQFARIPMTVSTTLDRTDVQGEDLPAGMTISMEESAGEGLILFDADAGRMHRMEMTSRMPLRMSMEMGDERMEIRQDITSTVRVERVGENGEAIAPQGRPAADDDDDDADDDRDADE